ncbi:MAG: membrane protein [Gemmatimonadales bacterium]|nr:MAG: membrane protein [Gemmatimonadales bacterium]
MVNRGRLWAIARKEAIQLRRDPRSLALAFLLPLFLIVFFGYAISFDVKDIRLGVLDYSQGPASRRLVESFQASGYFQVTRWFADPREMERALGRGLVRLALVIPPDFEGRLGSGRAAPLQLLLDGSDAATAAVAQNYAEAIVARFAAENTLRGMELRLPVEAEIRIWYNQTLESRNMVVPGLVAVIMSIIAAMLTALTIAREWERGTMEQLISTPVTRTEVVLGKLLPYMAIGLADVAAAITAGRFVFGVPLRGDLLLLAVLTLLFLVGALGVGMSISALVKSQLLATQAAIMSTYLPALLLSGFVFSISTMPWVLQAITHVVPARYYVAVTRGIFLKAVGAGVLWVDVVAMVLFAAAGLGLALAAFRKELG